MSYILQLSLYAYFLINFFILGTWHSSITTDKRDVKFIVIMTVIAIVFGLAFYIVWTTIRCAQHWDYPLVWINRKTQVKFWFKYWFSEHYENLTADQLEVINHNAKMRAGIRLKDQKALTFDDRVYFKKIKAIAALHPMASWSWLNNSANFISKK